MAKILQIYRKEGVPGFLVDVDNGGAPESIMRFQFAESMLENNKFMQEIETVLMQAKRDRELALQRATANRMPGAPVVDPIEAANAALANTDIKEIPFVEAHPVGDLNKVSPPREKKNLNTPDGTN